MNIPENIPETGQPLCDNDICWDCEHCRLKTCPALDKKPDGKHGLSCTHKHTNAHVDYGDSPGKRRALKGYLASRGGN